MVADHSYYLCDSRDRIVFSAGKIFISSWEITRRLRLQFFGSPAGGFAKAGIVDHPDFIVVLSEIGCVRCITGYILPVAVKIKYHPFAERIPCFKLDDVERFFFVYRQVYFFEGNTEIVGVIAG